MKNYLINRSCNLEKNFVRLNIKLYSKNKPVI